MNKKLNSVLLGILVLSLMVSTASATSLTDHIAGIGTMAHPTSNSGIAGCGGCHGTLGSPTTTGFCTGCHVYPVFSLSVVANPTSIPAGSTTSESFTVSESNNVKNVLTASSGAAVTLTGAATVSGTTDIAGIFAIPVNPASAGSIIATASKTGFNSGTAAVTVTAPVPVLTTVTISPLTPTVETPNTLQFTAAALDQNKAPIGATITWSSSDTTKGTINSATGLFTAVSQGTTTVTVTAVNGSTTVTNSTTVTVSAPTPNPVLTTVTISPLTPTVQTPNTLQFTAAALNQNKAPIGATLTWSSSDTTKGTINSATGLFTAVSQGTTTVTVTAVNGSTTVTNSTIVTVTQPNQNSEVKTIKVSPPKAKIEAGKSKTFIATAFDQFNQVISAIFTWSSSNTTVGTIDNTGKFTALSAGTTTITATNGTISGSSYVKVKASEKKHEENEEDDHEEDGHKDVKHIEKEKKDSKHEDEQHEIEDEIEDD